MRGDNLLAYCSSQRHNRICEPLYLVNIPVVFLCPDRTAVGFPELHVRSPVTSVTRMKGLLITDIREPVTVSRSLGAMLSPFAAR